MFTSRWFALRIILVQKDTFSWQWSRGWEFQISVAAQGGK